MKKAKPRMPTIPAAVKKVRKNHAALDSALENNKKPAPMKLAIIIVPNSPQVRILAPKIKSVLSRGYQKIDGEFRETFVFTLTDHPQAGRYKGSFKGLHKACFLSEYDDERNAQFVAMALLSDHCQKIEKRATVAQDE